MDTLGNITEYMSMANDYASCVEGESIYYSLKETVRNTSQDNSHEGNITLSELHATKIGDTTLQHEVIPANGLELKQDENFISSTPNKMARNHTVDCDKLFNLSKVQNKPIDGFLEVSKILRQISTKINAVQNKENININKKETSNETESSKLLGVKTMKASKFILAKPTVKITDPDGREKKSTQVPPTSSQNRMSIWGGRQSMRKSFIPSKFDVKPAKMLSPNKKVLLTKEPLKKECMIRKSIIPKSLANPTTSALKVTTKPRPSILNTRKSVNIRRSMEKLNVAVNKMESNFEYSKPISTIGKTLNIHRSANKLSVAFSQPSSSPEAQPSTSNTNAINLRRSIAKFQGGINKESTIFECTKCKRKFRMESNYLAHINNHNETGSDLVCKYCDKKFQLSSALQTHLREYCIKIPSKEKRLLVSDPKIQITPSKNNSKTNSMDSLNKVSLTNSATSDSSSMKPPIGQSLVLMLKENNKILKTVHSGVSRTPKKINKCKNCGKMFYSIFALQAHKTCGESDDETDGNESNLF